MIELLRMKGDVIPVVKRERMKQEISMFILNCIETLELIDAD